MSIFSKIWEHIQDIFTDAEREVVSFIEELAHSIARNGGTVLINAAASAVAAAELAGGSGSDKLKAAQNVVAALLVENGIPVFWNAINGAIEAAVAQHNQNLAEVDA